MATWARAGETILEFDEGPQPTSDVEIISTSGVRKATVKLNEICACYKTRATINGVSGTFIVDTGASMVSVTEEFAKTDEYRKMIDLGYVDIRYHETNPFGVRHEPWHIKIV